MGYDHTQRGSLHWLLALTALLCGVGAWVARADGWPAWVLLGMGVLVGGLAFCFASLSVRDDGDALALRFGPLPLFRHRLLYGAMASAVPARSSLIDGWGIHWLPGRGWIWNLWGYDCVAITLVHGRVRVGTDDRQGLADFLNARIRDGAAVS